MILMLYFMSEFTANYGNDSEDFFMDQNVKKQTEFMGFYKFLEKIQDVLLECKKMCIR